MKRIGSVLVGLALGSSALAGCSGKTDPKPTTDPKSNGSVTPPRASDGGTSTTDPPPDTTGWRAAVGAGGVIVQTFDDRTWETRNAGVGDLFGVACVGNVLGWAAGAGGFLGHTTDGGRTWAAQNSGVSVALRAVRFSAITFGVAVGDAGTITVTHNGGATWTVVPSGTAANLRAVAIAGDRGLALAVGDGGTMLRSDDAGATFHPVPIAGAADLHGVATDDGARSVVAVDANGNIFRSTNAGVTFGREATASAPLRGVAMDSHGAFTLAVGDGGLVMERGLDTWAVLDSGTTANLRGALLPSRYSGTVDYIVGEHGTLLARRHETMAWTAIATHTDATLFALDEL